MKNDKGSSGFLDTARLRDRAKDLLTERFSNPTARVLSSVGFTPNRVTIAGGLIAVAAGAVAAKVDSRKPGPWSWPPEPWTWLTARWRG